jgi:signal recognition particle subunit SRP72
VNSRERGLELELNACPFLPLVSIIREIQSTHIVNMATKEQQITTLFTELKKAVEDYDDELSLQVCDKLIKLNPDDQLTLQCKVVTLIRLEKYKEALTMIARQFRNSDIDLSYEKIYCYYRTNQLVPAMELLEEVKAKNDKQDDPSLLYLEAQLVNKERNGK